MNTIEAFDFNGAEVRTLTRDGEPWFVAGDVARVLGYRDSANMTRNLDADEKGTQIVSTPRGGLQSATVVNESGLYAAILRSRRPEAREFRRWVTGTVLPAIRRTGGYVRSDATAAQLATLTEQIAQLQREAIPAMIAWRTAEEFKGGYLLSDVAKGMGIPVSFLRAVMVDDRYLIADDRTGRRKYKPTQDMRNLGYMAADASGTVHVTRTGAEFLRRVYA